MAEKDEALARSIGEIFRLSVTAKGKTYKFEGGQSSFTVTADELSAVVDTMSNYQELDDLAVAEDLKYEVLVQSSKPSGHARVLFRNGLKLEDEHEGLSYEVDRPSFPYYLHVLRKLTQVSNKPARGMLFSPFSMARQLDRATDEKPHMFEVLSNTSSLYSLRITSDKKRSTSYWKPLAQATYFHLSYNLDVAFMPFKDIRELIRPSAISRVRRSRPADLDAPRRSYNQDLVHHYQLGVSAESPMLEYLSYYHIAEHLFENVYQADLVEQVQKSITSPAFSHKRKRDIQDLIKTVSKAVQLRNEEVIINELTALQLTLEKYVDIGDLAQDIAAFDPGLIQYYSSTLVSFSGGDKVDFDRSDDHVIFKALSKRIYKTRNSLVHSKDGAKSKFVPFADDASLLPEVPLMRFIAEQIILATSTP